MGELKSASTWMKLSMLMVSLAFSMHLFAMDGPGFGTDYGCIAAINGHNSCNPGKAVQALEIIGFIAVLTALFLVLCLVLLDELKGNKIALICEVVFAFIAGLMIIIGIAVYEAQVGYAPFSSTVACMAGIAALLGGIFGVLELVGVSPPPVK